MVLCSTHWERSGSNENKPVKIVVQRCDGARLLLDNDSEWATIGPGRVTELVIYCWGYEFELQAGNTAFHSRSSL